MGYKTNIAILIPSLACGGAEKSSSLLANYLAESGMYNVSFFILDSESPYYYLVPSIKVYHVDINCKVRGTIPRNFNRANYVRKLINLNNIEIIIGYTHLSSILACYACLGTTTKCIICERSDPSRYGIAIKTAKYFLYRRGNGAIFQTSFVQDYFKGFLKDGVIIPNFIESDKLPNIIPYSKRSKKIVSVGRLDKLKNHKLLISAISRIIDRIPDYTIEIYGDGELREDLQRQIHSLKLTDKVILKGKSNDVLNHIKDAKLFVFTSNCEGFPNALLEAISMGIPCISTDCPSYAQKNKTIQHHHS